MAIKLKNTVKKFSSTKPAWDELENCIKSNCSEPIKKLIEAGESQDKIKDTVNYLIDHIMEGDSENKEFSDDKVIEVNSVKDLLDKSDKKSY